MISVAAWVIDGGTFHIQDCKVDSFLMAAHQSARLNATEFVVSTSSGAGMLLSSGEVTMRASIKQGCCCCCCCCCGDMQVAISVCLSVFGMRSGSGIFNQMGSPQLRPTAGTLLLQLCKPSKKRNYTDILRFIMLVQHAEAQRSKNISDMLSETYKVIFGFSFPSRANVVKVTHLNVTGSEASISWASGISANVSWRFR